jgi:hypothetical protein
MWAAVGMALLATGCHDGVAGGRIEDAGVDEAPDLIIKLPPADAYCPADGPGGGGNCHLNECGHVKSVKSLPLGAMAQVGNDGLCTPGDVCVPDAPSAADTLLLRCVAPQSTTAAAYGQACTKGVGTALRCANDALCVAGPDAAHALFCTRLCGADYDCPADSACLEYPSATLPDGSYAALGLCTPKTKLAEPTCANEAACAADQGCVRYGARSSLLVCRKVGGTKSLGAVCAAGAECRSGECYDRDFKLPALGARDYCTGVCAKNSDCSADQHCVLKVQSNNDTVSNPFDDVVVGYCETLFVPVASKGCASNADCLKPEFGFGDTCDLTHGLCYKKDAPNGAACVVDKDGHTTSCDRGATCGTGGALLAGYCQQTGCDPAAAAGVDACSGTTSVCAQRFPDKPLSVCYEKCTPGVACSRAAERFVCTDVAGAPDAGTSAICLYSSGT